MPIALETSKRKFAKLLDSLTSTPSISVPRNDTTTAASKRARLSPHTDVPSSHPFVPSSSNTRHIPRASPRSSTPTIPILTAKEQEEADRPPNYAPWSTPLFLTRLKTFADVSRWTEKPDAINEVAWAKQGWVLDVNGDVKDKVACKGGCEERIVVGLRSSRGRREQDDVTEENAGDDEEQEYADVSEELVRRYEEFIVTGHAEACAWRERGCGNEVLRMPLARTAVWQEGLKQRYASFKSMEDKLPARERLMWPLTFDVQDMAEILSAEFFATHHGDAATTSAVQASAPNESVPEPAADAQLTPQPPQAINQTALAFAALGWQARPSPGPNTYPTAACPQCFRRLGLWLYTTSTTTTSSSQPSNGAPASSQAEQEDDYETTSALDLTASHRDYCPWISAITQANPNPGALADLNGWETLRKVVANWAGLQARSKARRAEELASLQGRSTKTDSNVGERIVEPDEGSGAAEMPPPSPARSREEVRREDNARFTRLRELMRAIGSKGLKNRSVNGIVGGVKRA